MANLFRLVACLLSLLACAASFALPLTQNWYHHAGGQQQGPFPSASAACNAYASFRNGQPYSVDPYTVSITGVQGSTCKLSLLSRKPPGYVGEWDPGTNSGEVDVTLGAPSCPPGSNPKTNAHGEQICECAPPLREQDGQCTALPPKCEAGYSWSEALQQCVITKCKPDEIRVNNLCVPDPDNCPDGKKKVNGKCEEACPKSGTFAGEYKVGGITPTTFCENKCTVSISNFLRAIKDGKVAETVGMGYYTGATCSGPGYTPPDPDKPNVPGNPDPNNPNNPNNPSNPGGGGGNNGGGNPPNTNGGNNPNPGGGNNTTPEKCPGGNCTGNSGGAPSGGTETGSDGGCPPGYYKSGGKCYKDAPPDSDPDDDGKCPPGTKKVNGRCVSYQPPSDEEQDKAKDFCKENPDIPMCKKSTFQGACEAGFQCDGDAIFCAIARDQHSRSCKLFDTKSAESDLYNLHKGKEGEQTKDLPGNRTESMLGRIDMTDALGGGQCVRDLPITVMGQSISLPISTICPAIGSIGNILVAVALLLAVRIVGRG